MGWSRFLRRARWDQERAREIQAYLDIETDENIARGLSPEEARLAARRKLGNPTLVREEIYRMNTLRFLEAVWQDLRYGVRLLRLNPAFTLVAVASLALGIGANTAIFQLLDAVRLRTLPVKSPQDLVDIHIENQEWASGSFNGRHPALTNALWEQIRDHQQAFSEMFAWGDDSFNLATGGEARIAQTLLVSGEYFQALGVSPRLGRVFTSADDRRGCPAPVAVISYPFWQREFGGQASVLGRKLTVAGHPLEIVGVTPDNFFGVEVGHSFDVAVPICADPILRGEDSRLDNHSSWWLGAMGRLKPGWTVERATAHLRTISRGLLEATAPSTFDPEALKHYLDYRFAAFSAGTGISALRRRYAEPLGLLLAIAGLVLLIACANLANLMLARASSRQREIAVRLAIGASRGRLVRQLLAESLLLAVIGAALGAALAQTLSRALVSFLSTRDNPLFVDLAMDWRVLGFTAAVAIITCVLFGLAPALRATRTAPSSAMRASGRGLTDSRERFGLRRLLVVSQVALSLVLLVGAMLFVRSFRNLITMDAGFRQNGILIASLDFTHLTIPKDRRLSFRRDLLDRVRSIAGVEGAAEVAMIPVSGNNWRQSLRADETSSEDRNTAINRVSAGYFKTLGTPLLAGRDFDDRDSLSAPLVAIVNEAFAREMLKTSNPVGRRFKLERPPGQPEPFYEVVGLVKDTKYSDLRSDFAPILFLSATQENRPGLYDQLLVRSSAPLTDLVTALKRTFNEVSPDISLEFSVFQTQIRESLMRERLMANLSGFFGFLAALLATIGLYGVMSYMVVRRRGEIGIRMALGAGRRDVLSMILGEAGLLVVAGLIVGTALALVLARTADAMLFGLKPHDPVTLILSIVALATVAALASYLPARRAAATEPMIALRDE